MLNNSTNNNNTITVALEIQVFAWDRRKHVRN
jgi:hypothetical protein